MGWTEPLSASDPCRSPTWPTCRVYCEDGRPCRIAAFSPMSSRRASGSLSRRVSDQITLGPSGSSRHRPAPQRLSYDHHRMEWPTVYLQMQAEALSETRLLVGLKPRAERRPPDSPAEPTLHRAAWPRPAPPVPKDQPRQSLSLSLFPTVPCHLRTSSDSFWFFPIRWASVANPATSSAHTPQDVS